MAMKKCPVCGVPVKAENLERHVKNQHPRENVDLSETLTEEDREAIEEAKATRPGLTRRGRRMLLIVGLIVVALVALAILYPVLFGGSLVTDFTLSSTDSTTVSTSAWRGSPVLVEFMDLDCPYCQQEAPTLLSLYRNYTPRGVHFVSVDMNFDPPADTPARINSERSNPGSPFYGSSWPYCLDPGQSVQNNYGVSSTPTIFILKKDGTVYSKYVGITEASYGNLVAGLNAALGG